jgi:hypothetical protein
LAETFCNCQIGTVGGEATLTGVNSENACAVALGACLDAAGSEQAECSFTQNNAVPSYCDIARTCASTPQDVADGVSVTTRRLDGVSCSPYIEGSLCSCYATAAQLRFEGIANTQTCEQAFAVCEEGLPEDLGPPSCTQDSVYASRYDCNIQEQCARKGTTSSGVAVQSVEYRATYCTNWQLLDLKQMQPGQPQLAPPSNDWECACSGPGGNGDYFDVQSESSLSACEQAQKTCLELFE